WGRNMEFVKPELKINGSLDEYILVDGLNHHYRYPDSFPEIAEDRDLRRILPLEDNDPLFSHIGSELAEIREKHREGKLCLEIPSPLDSLMHLISDDPQITKMPSVLINDPYSFLLAMDSLCVDSVNIALRAVLDGRFNAICLRVHNESAVPAEVYEKFIAPSEIHFLEEVRRFPVRLIVKVADCPDKPSDASFYMDYPADEIITK
ncbi:MAG: hypothetical protein IKH73_08100, partial [Erysipelotrichaceae bacterium]|nr:hypothetical protein [Erysipelotrichaceae bacterium]